MTCQQHIEESSSAHRKFIKHVHEPGHAHAFTFSCYHCRPLLTSDDWRTRFSGPIDKACKQYRFDLIAFVDSREVLLAAIDDIHENPVR
ncbi:MAG: hypothetical protein WEB58_19290 [Planctomycetaceae bacterium]